MLRTRRPFRSQASTPFALLSVLALLALACFPAFAHAEGSSVPEYETEVPTVTGHTTTSNHQHNNNPTAGSSSSGGNSGSGSGHSGGSGSGSSGGGSSTGQKNGTAGNGGTSQSNQGNGSNVQSRTLAQGGTGQGQSPGSTSSGGSSSPLVPILIAIAVLAAISIGVVVFRQRRQGGDSGGSVSPKAS